MGIALIMGLLRASAGDIGTGIASGVVMLALFSPLLLFWHSQITQIRRCAEKLAAGKFLVAEAEGIHTLANRWNRHFVCAAHIRFSDGTVFSNARIPYYQAVRQGSKDGIFPVWLALIDGEKKPIVFLRPIR